MAATLQITCLDFTGAPIATPTIIGFNLFADDAAVGTGTVLHSGIASTTVTTGVLTYTNAGVGGIGDSNIIIAKDPAGNYIHDTYTVVDV